MWFILYQYFGTRRATPLVLRLQLIHENSSQKRNCLRHKWQICWREKMFQDKRRFLRWVVFCTEPSRWQPFNFHVHKCSRAMAPFGNWLSAGQIMMKLGHTHTHTVTTVLCCLTHPAKFWSQNGGLKMPLWVLLIFKRVERLLTSPDAVKSPWPRTKMLHCYCWQYCWHTVLGLDNDFFFSWGKKKSWEKLLNSELIRNWRQFKCRHYLPSAAFEMTVDVKITSCRRGVSWQFLCLLGRVKNHMPNLFFFVMVQK